MIELLGYDGNNTDGSDFSLMYAVYQIAGRRVKVPADYTPQQIRDYVKSHYQIDDAHFNQLEQLESVLSSLDYSTITTLTANSTNAELVAAIQTLAQALRPTVAMLRFMMKHAAK